VTIFKADLPMMQAWAAGIMASRPCDFDIGPGYMHRWWAIPRNPFANVYLHRILRSDDDRALHDHPWPSTSVIIAGGYVEHTPDGAFSRKPGDVVSRPADALHRLEVIPGVDAVTLFLTGPEVREWGFACPQGWVHHNDFTDALDAGRVGRGCGEPGDPVRHSIPGTSLLIADAGHA
jgi:hypothetical protein